MQVEIIKVVCVTWNGDESKELTGTGYIKSGTTRRLQFSDTGFYDLPDDCIVKVRKINMPTPVPTPEATEEPVVPVLTPRQDPPKRRKR